MPVCLPDAELIAQTDLAILVEFDDGSSEPEIDVNRFWIPRSVITETDGEFDEEGDIADLYVRTWFVRKEQNLENFAEE